jgi:hypothetical protein
MAKLISLGDALKFLDRFPSLVAGPGISSTATVFRDVAEATRRDLHAYQIDTGPTDSYLDIIDSISPEGGPISERVKQSIIQALSDVPPSHQLPTLAQLPWSAIVSLSPEACLEGVFRTRLDRLPSSRTLTIVDYPDISPDLRTTPVFKLLGNPRTKRPESAAVVSRSELLLRQQLWANMLRTLPDYVRDGWILLVGTEPVQNLVELFFATILMLPPPRPTRFMTLKGDATATNSTITNLLRSRGASLCEVDCTIKQYCAAITNRLSEPKQYSFDPPSPHQSATRLEEFLSKYRSFIQLVPNKFPAGFDPSAKHHQLVDALFRPTSVDWNPFLAGYHLSRTQAVELANSIRRDLADPLSNGAHYYVLRGEAGTGKTCAMKEAASLLAKDGVLCLWVNRLPLESAQNLIRGLIADLSVIVNSSKNSPSTRAAIFLDESWSARIDPADLVSEVDAKSLPIAVVVSFRNSELMADTGIAFPIPVKVDLEIELSMALDDAEREALPEVLLRIGAAANFDEARRRTASVNGRNASDVLCTLWFLVPETRSSISNSIEDEYFALGGVGVLVQRIAENAERMSEKAKIAYECAAVCSDLQTGMPTEILVRAMGVNYDEWLDMCVEGRPLWGLLYPDNDGRNGQTVYWTRNDVVTRILIDLVNGGFGHAGEVRILAGLIEACSIGTAVYRGFLVDLLVRNRKKLSDRFTLEQGIELFEKARSSLPHPDKTIEHQYGLWLKDKGAATEKAHKQLLNALDTPDYPMADTAERAEHIHTSIAAVVVSQARDGERSAESAVAAVNEHLRLAQSPSFFNPHTTHVFANLLLELAHMQDASSDRKVQLQAVGEALATIERTFQIIGASGRGSQKYAKDVEMLGTVQEKLLNSFCDDEELQTAADELFAKGGSQVGYVVLCRRKLMNAARSRRGRDYKQVKDCLDRCCEKIREAHGVPGERLVAVRVDLYIRWQIQGARGPVDWLRLYNDLDVVCQSAVYKDDMIKLFYMAVVLFHLDRAPDANVFFHRLRVLASPKTVKHASRCFLLGKEGLPKRVQGKLRQSHERWYVEAPEYGTDFLLRDRGQNIIDGRDVHCYVGFTFLGPFAQLKRPDPDGFVLPG